MPPLPAWGALSSGNWALPALRPWLAGAQVREGLPCSEHIFLLYPSSQLFFLRGKRGPPLLHSSHCQLRRCLLAGLRGRGVLRGLWEGHTSSCLLPSSFLPPQGPVVCHPVGFGSSFAAGEWPFWDPMSRKIGEVVGPSCPPNSESCISRVTSGVRTLVRLVPLGRTVALPVPPVFRGLAMQ